MSGPGSTFATICRYLWASPTTALGLLAALASLSAPRIQGPILLCRSRRGFARLFLTRRGYCAITLGHLVLITPDATPEILTHEYVHVRQAERWGPLFLPAYLAAMLATRAKGKDPYLDNPFEVEARRRAQGDSPLSSS
ncbi:MAG: hypothetical protein ACM3US_01925 [Sphingomonadaceae bacterium]